MSILKDEFFVYFKITSWHSSGEYFAHL